MYIFVYISESAIYTRVYTSRPGVTSFRMSTKSGWIVRRRPFSVSGTVAQGAHFRISTQILSKDAFGVARCDE